MPCLNWEKLLVATVCGTLFLEHYFRWWLHNVHTSNTKNVWSFDSSAALVFKEMSLAVKSMRSKPNCLGVPEKLISVPFSDFSVWLFSKTLRGSGPLRIPLSCTLLHKFLRQPYKVALTTASAHATIRRSTAAAPTHRRTTALTHIVEKCNNLLLSCHT